MIIHSVEIEGFRSYGDKQVLDFEPGKLYLVTGENRDRGISSGAGKSSIFKAITTALFEENDDGSTHDTVINTVRRDQGCRIAVSFIDDAGVPYYVVYARQHPKEGTHWTLYRWDGQNWQPEKGARNTDTKKIIRDHIRMTYDQFVNQAYIPQSKIADFITRTDKERKAIFGNILNLDECDKYIKVASEWRKSLRQELLKGQGVVTTLQAQVAAMAKTLVAPEEIAQWSRELQEQQARLRVIADELASLEEEAKKLRLIAELQTKERLLKDRVQQLAKTCSQKAEDFSFRFSTFKTSAQLEAEVEAINAQVCDLQNKHAMANAEVRQAEMRLQHVESLKGECAECEQAVSDELRQSLHTKYTRTIKELTKKRDALKDALQQMLSTQKSTQGILRDMRAYEADMTANHALLQTASNDLQKVVEQLKTLKECIGTGVHIPEKIEEEKKDLLAEQLHLTQAYTQLKTQIETAENSRSQYEKLNKQLQHQITINEKNEKSIKYIERCEELIGDKGFKSFKIHSSRDAFNNSLAKYLSILTDGEVHAELVTEVPKADGKGVKTELDILVKDGNKKHVPIRLYSGGEKAALSLAITGAFGDLSMEQADANVNLLLLDEPFANLDTWGEEQMCKLLEHLTGDGRTVLVITNHRSVRDSGRFDKEIRAVKQNHVTHIEEYDLSGEH